MSKQSELERAGKHLSKEELKKYESWLSLPFVARYPYLSDFVITFSLVLNLILLVALIFK